MLAWEVLKPLSSSDPLSGRAAFRKALRVWFDAEGRDYPWRRTRDPWAILVAEVMLQQTQIATVLGRGYYARFLHRFPDPAALATAGEPELLKVWEGLGYYRRARMLQAAARQILHLHGGIFPRDLEAISRLPGVGRYTAGALASFAFDTAAPIVDGNVARVLARLLDFTTEVDSAPGQRQLWAWASELVDPQHPRVFNSALMELGQRICRPDRPACHDCPVAQFCLTLDPLALPRKKPARKSVALTEQVVWQADPRRGVLLHQETGSRRQGLWKLPQRSAQEVAALPHLHTTAYTITHYKVTLHVHHAASAAPARDNEAWQHYSALDALPMPAPYRRVLDTLLAREPQISHGIDSA
jgi:A/G-specific adenine glycosylase